MSLTTFLHQSLLKSSPFFTLFSQDSTSQAQWLELNCTMASFDGCSARKTAVKGSYCLYTLGTGLSRSYNITQDKMIFFSYASCLQGVKADSTVSLGTKQQRIRASISCSGHRFGPGDE